MGEKSKILFKKARQMIPGGVNSPVRAGKAVGIDPPFISHAEGCFLWDVEGNRYIDYVGSWGPMILGHSHPEVVKAIEERLCMGTSYGAPTELEVLMAETIIDMVPSIEMVRMVNSGTEATMSAIRLARGFTGRDRIVKFEGCYHGHADCLLVEAGSGVATLGIPGCPGVPGASAEHTISLPFNGKDEVVDTFEAVGPEIAAVILEPVPGNMGVVLPEAGFLEGLREITRKHGALLIFDEVINGFRIGPGGAQAHYGIEPDLTCLGKVIGGGLPVGAYGGRREIMERMAPEGDVYQAGTLSGNPLAMAAGLTTLKILKKGGIYEDLEKRGAMFFEGIQEAARSAGIVITVNRIGSMGSLFFTAEQVKDFASAKKSNVDLFKGYYANMLQQGIYLAPSAFEASFLSIAHDEEIIQQTLGCVAKSFKAIKRGDPPSPRPRRDK
jgi:glutamate-1-semialdehyde 2,1-aminomutase